MPTAREAILEAAISQFAEHGYSGASLREILRAAGANVAAAHYHFGSKEEVYREVVSRYMSSLCEQRRQSLAAIGTSGNTRQRLERLVRAYVEPHIRLCTEPDARDYIRLMARYITEDNAVSRRINTEILEPVRSLYLQAMAQAAPGLPRPTLHRLFSFMVVLMVTAPADASYQSMAGQSPWPSSPDQLIEQIVSFVTAGFAKAAQEAASARRGAGTRARRSARART